MIICDLPMYSFSLIELFNHVLYLNGLNLEVEEIQSDHHQVPPKNHRVSPAHSSPGPSTYPAKCSDHPSTPSTSLSSAQQWRPRGSQACRSWLTPAHQSRPTQPRCPRLSQALRRPHMCPWEYLWLMRVCLGVQR